MSGIRGVEFLWSSGKSSGLMTLLSTRSCTFIRESSFNGSGAKGVNTDWNCWFNMFAFSVVSVCRFPFCLKGGMLVGPGVFEILEEGFAISLTYSLIVLSVHA